MRDWQNDFDKTEAILQGPRILQTPPVKALRYWLKAYRELEAQAVALKKALQAIATVTTVVEEIDGMIIRSTPTLESVQRYARERLTEVTAGQALLWILEKEE